jgi:hypothetical protein
MSPSLWMGAFAQWASIARVFRECCTMHSASSATMGTLLSTAAACLWPIGQDKCEVNVVIPLNPMEPWMATIIGVELDGTVEQTAQVALTSLCETRLADTVMMPIALFLMLNQEDPVWMQCLEAVSNPKGPHFHAGMAALAGYA